MKSCLLALVLLVLPAAAQPRQKFVINTGTPEGQLLQTIGQENDDAKKLALMQDFLSKYPKHEGASWVYALMVTVYSNQKEYDKAVDAGEKAMALDPEDVDTGINAIKAAEAKNDPDAIKTLAATTSASARKLVAKPPESDEDKQMAEHIKEVGLYAEYALYKEIASAKDSKKVSELGEALEQANPKSPYLWYAAPSYLRSLGPKACGAAEKMVAADSRNAEAMLFAADCSWRTNHPDRMVTLGTRSLEALNTRPKTEGMNDGGKAGIANFYVGVGYGMEQRFGPGEKALRAALPSVRGDATLGPYALFYLALSEYSLAKPLGDKSKIREAMGFFEQSAAMKSSVQDQAARNARLIRTELGGR